MLRATAHQVFHMATVNGAHGSWFGDRIGTLEPGKRADMTLINLRNIEEPYFDPDTSIVDAVVHRGRSIDVDTVLIDGELVMRDGRLSRIDKEALFKELKAQLSCPPEAYEIERKELSKQLEPYLRRFYEGTMPQNSSPHSSYNSRF
jgi:5-methylthioadenosine/S-adenosylhomocysteine deaminase